MMYADAHAHIANIDSLMNQIEKVVDLIKKNNVDFVVDHANNFSESRATLELSKKYPNTFYPTIGIHPEVLIPGSDIYEENFDIEQEMEKVRRQLLENRNEYVAVGECGLDYYWIEKKIKDEFTKDRIKNSQKELFANMVKLSCETELPLVVHSRGAEKESFDLVNNQIKKNEAIPKVLFHSYTGSLEIAKKILSKGIFLSFNGILTFPKAEDIRTLFLYSYKNYPNQILAETDAPFLAPQKKRGGLCYPSYVRFVFEEMKYIVGVDKGKIDDTIYRNIKSFYNLPR